ncbi:acyl-CoA dehydrogenase family protein [Ferrimonas pelagia]|uniref:Acyl-CoA dehydrogenase family protein n=1 Tax=Ferrimonas pelagia TaxID=1177826 RepID=A0ABP9EHH8_9GAMM
MNFDFSDEHKMIRKQAKVMLREHASIERVRGVLDSEAQYDTQLWQQMVELGWPAVAIPEQYGGLGMGQLAQCVIAEQLGASLAPTPFASSSYLATELLLLAGSDTQKQHWLPQLAEGAVIGTVAISDGDTPCVYQDGAISGIKLPVADGMAADFALVRAQEVQAEEAENDELVDSWFVVALAPTLRKTVDTLDPTRSAALIQFESTPAERLGASGQAPGLQSQLFDRAAVLLAFEQLGGAGACLQASVAYSMGRYAFSKPIASFQAIKHKLADVFTAIELLRANAMYGAWALAEDAPDLPLAAATARVAGCQAYTLAAAENIQVHGGNGFTWEFDCHLHYRRAAWLDGLIGGEDVWKHKLVDALKTTEQV